MKSFRKNGKEKPIIIGDNNKRKRHGFFRFLKNFKFPDLSDNPKVQFMNKFSLLFHGLLACILVFTIECVSRHSFTSAVSFCISSPLTFLYNALLIFATLLIVYLVTHHHSPDAVDGLDYLILIEADYLVNADEMGLSAENIRNFRDCFFRQVISSFCS